MPSPKPWADGPFALLSSSMAGVKVCEPTILSMADKADDFDVQKDVKTRGSDRMAEDMIVIHNLIIRIINTVYLQCVNVEHSPDDVQDFVSYALEWGKMVEEHHHTEETEVFPEIERMAGVPGLMAANVAQHEAFSSGLYEYMEFLSKVQRHKEAYTGERLKSIIDSFMPVLRQHLSDEIETLLKLRDYDCDWEDWFDKLVKRLLSKSSDPRLKTTTIPLLLTNRDKTFEDGAFAWWPALPWFVQILFRWVFIPTHKRWWRFSSCDDQGVPKDLPFA
ncbi:hemerythrin HHE cation binding domain-containing protein [Colletotrichum musicola]|uniref:Hemerythrin HHE cation binding domain-containing protein n=1 Tax=Colletotrichum musicola TaxID=2175873 RepID=A0A8H6KFS0_9PEZI|nr:hemerythrin HHE cation binding domain-containing protein [Colletotrichum musicola]